MNSAPPEELAGRRYIVTGGSSGIGASCVELLRRRGADVVVVDRNAPVRDDVDYQQVDLSDPEAIRRFTAAVGETHGLLNVAGVAGTAPRPLVYAVNFLAIRELVDGLVDRMPSGSAIVNVSSLGGSGWATHRAELDELAAARGWDAGVEWFAQNSGLSEDAYGLSKEALIHFTLTHARSLFVDRGVRMNVVMPGPVETPLLGEFQKVAEMLGRPKPPSEIRPATSHEIAGPVVFLATPGSEWMVGQNITIDGGLTAVPGPLVRA